jgi:hypothetical protein
VNNAAGKYSTLRITFVALFLAVSVAWAGQQAEQAEADAEAKHAAAPPLLGAGLQHHSGAPLTDAQTRPVATPSATYLSQEEVDARNAAGVIASTPLVDGIPVNDAARHTAEMESSGAHVSSKTTRLKQAASLIVLSIVLVGLIRWASLYLDRCTASKPSAASPPQIHDSEASTGVSSGDSTPTRLEADESFGETLKGLRKSFMQLAQRFSVASQTVLSRNPIPQHLRTPTLAALLLVNLIYTGAVHVQLSKAERYSVSWGGLEAALSEYVEKEELQDELERSFPSLSDLLREEGLSDFVRVDQFAEGVRKVIIDSCRFRVRLPVEEGIFPRTYMVDGYADVSCY